MNYPSEDEIELLHKKYAPSVAAYEMVYTHSLIVNEIAQEIIRNKKLKVDEQLVEVGCMVHDVGVYKLFLPSGEIDGRNYITHGIKGHGILKEEGYPEAICRFADHHTGVGLTKNDVISQNLPLSPRDYTADTIEEKIVMYADDFHSKTPTFNSVARYKERISRFGFENAKAFQAAVDKFGEPNIKLLSEKYRQPIDG